MKLLITVSFLGTAYCGYQVQPNGISVQSMLNRATGELFGYPCDIVGCSRTDSGVHANRFCATVARRGEPSLKTGIPADRIPVALSAHLPEDIRVMEARWVPDDFHARYRVVEKEYLYRIDNGRVMSPFEVGRAFHDPRPLGDEALEKMRTAAEQLVGTHDFTSFMAEGSRIVDATRTVKRVLVSRDGNLILFRIAADGFLYHMVRIIVGTLLEIGHGNRAPDEIQAILACRDRSRAGFTAPAHGLYLDQVIYPPFEEMPEAGTEAT